MKGSGGQAAQARAALPLLPSRCSRLLDSTAPGAGNAERAAPKHLICCAKAGTPPAAAKIDRHPVVWWLRLPRRRGPPLSPGSKPRRLAGSFLPVEEEDPDFELTSSRERDDDESDDPFADDAGNVGIDGAEALAPWSVRSTQQKRLWDKKMAGRAKFKAMKEVEAEFLRIAVQQVM